MAQIPIFKSIILQIVVILGTILFVALLPVIALAVICAFSFRSFLKLYVHQFHSEFGKMVTIRSTIFATDYPNRNTLTGIVLPTIFKGRIDIDKLMMSITNKVNQKLEDGSFKYPELHQSLSSFCGYRFWKWDKQFDINNHVHLGYENKTVLDEKEMAQITAKLLRKTYGNRSPWEVYLFPEYKKKLDTEESEPNCIVLIRYSHCMADGFAVFEMISEASKSPLKEIEFPKPSKLQILQMVFYRLVSVILAPYQLMTAFISASDKNYFKRKDEKDLQPLVVRFNDPIPSTLIKQLKNKLETSFEAILVTAYTAGLRKFMLENKMDLPYSIHSVIPIPLMGRRQKLRNYLKYSQMEYPVGVADPDARQRLIASNCAALRVSRLPEQLYYLSLPVGCFPIVLHRMIGRSFRLAGVTSTLASPFLNTYYHEHRLEDIMFSIGLHHGHTWFGISCLTFEGNLRIQSNFIESMAANGKLDALRDGIAEEIQRLINLHLV